MKQFMRLFAIGFAFGTIGVATLNGSAHAAVPTDSARTIAV